MQRKLVLEIWLCIGLVCLGVLALMTIGMAEDSASPFLLQQERSMGTLDYQTLPNISAIALIVLSIANIGLITFKSKRTTAAQTEKTQTADHLQAKIVQIRTAGTALLLVLYTLVLPHVPFFISTAIFLGLLFWLYGRKNWKITLCVACVGAGFFWFIFVYVSSLAL